MNHFQCALRLLFVIVSQMITANGLIAQDAEFFDEIRFQFRAANDTLVADQNPETTLIAVLRSDDGRPLDDEQVQFAIEEGAGTLYVDERRESRQVSIDAFNIGNGVYVGRLFAERNTGSIIVSAQWLSAPQTPMPAQQIPITVIASKTLAVRADNSVVLANGEDTATIVAYVLDEQNTPHTFLEEPGVVFRILEGAGTLTAVERNNGKGVNGRYAAVYRSGDRSGAVIIEAAIPAILRPVQSTITIHAVESSTLDAIVFPQQVARQSGPNLVNDNIATILVIARDGDGKLVRGLPDNRLQAEIITGPGSIIGPQEIQDAEGNSAGIYQFTFVASDIVGQTTIDIIDPEAPVEVGAQVTINTITDISPGLARQINIEAVADDLPFYADGKSQALVFVFAADDSDNAIRNEDNPLEIRLVSGQGQIDNRITHLDNLVDLEGTGIYFTTYTPGSSRNASTGAIRAIFANTNGEVVTGATNIELQALRGPEVVVFPSSLQAGRRNPIILDIYDFEDIEVDTASEDRYRVAIDSGPGQIVERLRNDGMGADLVTNDRISAVVYEINGITGLNQQVVFSVRDEILPGILTTFANLQIGSATKLRTVIVRQEPDSGNAIQVIAFAEDEFDLPAINRDLEIAVIEGAAVALENGRMIDTGSDIAAFKDAYANDGVYVGAIESDASNRNTIRLRITDKTAPGQPFIEVVIDAN